MDVYRLELFDAGGSHPQLRWVAPDGRLQERSLKPAEVEELSARVETAYDTSQPDLARLGADLYRWLDGPTERWLATAGLRQQPMLVYLDARECLRALPWELLYDDGYLSVRPARPVLPVRAASVRQANPRDVANRPLRVLFMASSPREVTPVLDFEDEEAVILAASPGSVDVVVEESGSLSGLSTTVAWFGPSYFDVLHPSGHAFIGPSGPRFVMEDEDGGRADVSADEIAQAVGADWPGLVFLSGCSTGGAPQAGLLASMAEALVQAGAPAVLGWALPVGDISASSLAATLYQHLGRGAGIPAAVNTARQALFTSRSDYWHLLRLYADRSPLGPLVTALGCPGRVRLRTREASQLFLDPDGRVKVPDRRSFVGRRRDLQSLLRRLRPEDPAAGPQLALLHGLGGLGKSSLTARLLDRIRGTHPQHAVWVGRIDTLAVQTLTQRLTLANPDTDQAVRDLLARDTALSDRLRYILDGPLADIACVFVFDDFESGNLEPDGQGGQLCTPQALDVLQAFGTAISRTGSPSRVVITSRYDFPLPAALQVLRHRIGPLDGADLEKKLRLTRHLGPVSQVDRAVRDRAVEAAAGIPRLLERLDDLMGLDLQDLDTLLARIAATQVDYREELLLQQLLDAQPSPVRRVIALAAVYEIAVPLEAILALQPDPATREHLHAAIGAGLVQAGLHPSSGEERFLVSPLLRPLLEDLPERLDDQDRQLAQSRGGQYLFQRWVGPGGQ